MFVKDRSVIINYVKSKVCSLIRRRFSFFYENKNISLSKLKENILLELIGNGKSSDRKLNIDNFRT